MDRRRKGPSQPPIAFKSSTTIPRRGVSLRLRSAFSANDTVYTFLSICLLLLVFLIITAFDSFSTVPTLLNRQTHAHLAPGAPSIFQSPFSAVGSAKQLQLLIQNITSHSHASNSSAIPTSLIVAVAVNYAYRHLALNFICNLNRLKISNYVVLAMDRPVFDYLSQRNAHVFFHSLRHDSFEDDHPLRHQPRRRAASHSRHLSSLSIVRRHPHGNDSEHVFGSTSFVETSRRKSILVLRILSLGYSVLFSDVDVAWVSNPIPHMLKHSADFVFQSDRSAKLPDSPLNYNINSGLYLARAASQTVVAMRSIIKYAYAIHRSEQKAFNYVLCGAFKDNMAGPGRRVGSTRCIFGDKGTTAQVLPLDAFPNGSDDALWTPSQTFARDHPNVVVVHANYVEGREKKVQRIRDIGFWFHSEEAHTRDECLFQPISSSS